ncbi:MAG: ATP-binding protein [Trueperaceae bacterium]
MDFEKLGTFYLGSELEADARTPSDRLLLYDAKDLTTHAVIVGMTGSGKTGLGVGLIEEAVLDGVPVLAIDPKGDLANLALAFPDLAPSDFEPWVDPATASRKGVDVPTFAAQQAKAWRDGLAAHGQDGARVARYRDAADVRVYTPGSTAGRPLSILKSFGRPPDVVMDDPELLAERLTASVSALLTLVGRSTDPTGRDHVLVATLLEHLWRSGRDAGLADLILGVQTPPFTQIGVLDVDTFAPPSERAKLAMAMNAVLASPGFATWLQGEPMDVGRMLFRDDGRPRVAVVSVAHLSDAERTTVIALLLNEVLAWTRAQSGTGSLRALVYVDELFGFMPPVAAPPTKAPLLTLLKQARAFGVGLVLSTQNPVDLDYKGLSNAGTWFVGRLQTEQDKARLLSGLLSADGGGGLDRGALDATLSSLGARTFLLHNVHETAPALFTTRWVMSYLAGPMTREQLRRLPASVVGADTDVAVPATAPARAAAARPALPPAVHERFVPAHPGVRDVTYHPQVVGFADVRYAHGTYGVDEARRIVRAVEPSDGAVAVDWTASEAVAIDLDALGDAPLDGAAFEPPAARLDARTWARVEKEFARHLRGDLPLTVHRHKGLKLISGAGEDEAAFRVRVRHAAHEARDAEREKLRAKFEKKAATLAKRLRRAEQTIERHAQAANQRRMDAAIQVGSTLLGSFLGRRSPTASRIGTALKTVNRASSGGAAVDRAKETAAAVASELAALEADLEGQLTDLATGVVDEDAIEALAVRPKSSDVAVRAVCLVWRPFARGATGTWADVGRVGA